MTVAEPLRALALQISEATPGADRLGIEDCIRRIHRATLDLSKAHLAAAGSHDPKDVYEFERGLGVLMAEVLLLASKHVAATPGPTIDFFLLLEIRRRQDDRAKRATPD